MRRSDLKHVPHARRGAADGPDRGGDDEPPPVLGSWAALYGLVIAGLVLMIALCAAITWWAS